MTGALGSVVKGAVSGFMEGAASVISPIANFFLARKAITIVEPHLATVGRRGERLLRDGVNGGNRLARDTGSGVERVARDVARSGERLVRDGATGGTSLVRDAGNGGMKIATGLGRTIKKWGDNTGNWGKQTVNTTLYTARRWGDNVGRTVTGGFIAGGIIYLANESAEVFSKYHRIAATACKANPDSSYCLADRVTAHLSLAGPLTAVLVLGVAIYLAPRVLWRGPEVVKNHGSIQSEDDGLSDASNSDEECESPNEVSRAEDDGLLDAADIDEECESPHEVLHPVRSRP